MQAVLQEGMAGKNEDSRGGGIDMEIGDELKFPEILVFEEMGLVKTNDRDEVAGGNQCRDLSLDGLEEIRLEKCRRAGQCVVELPVEISGSDGGQGQINRQKGLLVERGDQATESG